MSNLRIAGLASGMDTDAMVQSLMKVERLKVDRFEQSKQIALWRQEAYTSMNKMFANFILNSRKDMGLTRISSTGMAFDNSYSSIDYIRKATSSDDTKATATSTSRAINGSFDLEVVKLAVAAKGGIYAAQVTEDSFDGQLTFEVNGVEITVGETGKKATMDQIVNAINEKKGETGVTASYNRNGRTLIMETIEKGAGKKVDFTGHPFGGNSVEGTDGENAIVKFNGIQLEYSTNDFELNGVSIEAKSIGKTTVKVDTNVDGIMEKIEKLINDYNELVDKASMVVNEKRYASYHPLSQEEKKGMHEDDVKLWMEKSKSGMLNRDETITRALQTARNELYKTFEGGTGSFDLITQIGISTERYARGTAGGKLQIDKEKLRAAIMKDPEGVMELLFKESNEEPTEPKYSTKGIFTRVYDSLIDGMKSIIDKSGPGQDSDLFRNVKPNILFDFVTKRSSISDLDKEVLDVNKRIDDLNAMLARKESSYYAKFGNMEKMLQQMYSQSNWLSQQFMR